MEKLCSLQWSTLVSMTSRFIPITFFTHSKASDPVNDIVTVSSTMQVLCSPLLYWPIILTLAMSRAFHCCRFPICLCNVCFSNIPNSFHKQVPQKSKCGYWSGAPLTERPWITSLKPFPCFVTHWKPGDYQKYLAWAELWKIWLYPQICTEYLMRTLESQRQALPSSCHNLWWWWRMCLLKFTKENLVCSVLATE